MNAHISHISFFINTFLVLMVLMVLVSCEGILYLEPKNRETSANYYLTDENALKALMAVHRATVDDKYYWIWDFAGDDGLKGGQSQAGTPERQEVAEFVATSSNSQVLSTWQQHFTAINRANEVITNLEKQDGITDARKIVIGEAKFLRAFAYHRLVEIFGKVPLLDHVPVYSEIPDIQRSLTEKQVYDFIRADLDAAIRVLPIKGNTDPGRITSGAARALKARVVMRETGYAYNSVLKQRAPEYGNMVVKELWEEVYTQTSAVISSDVYGLLDNYAEVFEDEGENGPETVYDFQYVRDLSAPEGTGNNTVRDRGIRGWGGWSQYLPTDGLFHEFSRNGDKDPRRECTIVSDEWPVAWGFEIVAKYIRGSNLDDYLWLTKSPVYDYQIFKSTRKGIPSFYDREGGISRTPTNARIIRYSDVLLMKAEAAYYLGLESEARALVNQVRSRARKSTYPKGAFPGDVDTKNIPTGYRPFPGARVPDIASSGYALLEDIWHERRVEFSMEGHRYYDLVRQGNIEKLFYPGNYITKKGLQPIPEIEVSMYGLKQNEGY